MPRLRAPIYTSVTVAEFADIVGEPRQTINSLIVQGKLKPNKSGVDEGQRRYTLVSFMSEYSVWLRSKIDGRKGPLTPLDEARIAQASESARRIKISNEKQLGNLIEKAAVINTLNELVLSLRAEFERLEKDLTKGCAVDPEHQAKLKGVVKATLDESKERIATRLAQLEGKV